MLIVEVDTRRSSRVSPRKLKKSCSGGGIINSLINKLPLELHLPGGYQFCGPGTKLEKRLARGDQGINRLDIACRAYISEDLATRHKADYELEQRAWERVRSKDAKIGEKAAAWLVVNIMKGKRRVGMGCQEKLQNVDKKQKRKIRRKQDTVKGRRRGEKKVTFGSGIVYRVRQELNKRKQMLKNNPLKAAEIALRVARHSVKMTGGKQRIRLPRVIPIPKVGGILPLLPIFAGLSALGTLTGGAAAVAKAVQEAKIGRQQLTEANRHNKTMEAIALTRSGKGLRLKPYRTGLGLYLRPPLHINSNSKNF